MNTIPHTDRLRSRLLKELHERHPDLRLSNTIIPPGWSRADFQKSIDWEDSVMAKKEEKPAEA